MFTIKSLTLRRFLILLLVTLIANAQSVVSWAQDGGASSAVTYSGGMSGQAIITVSAAVVALTQIVKWSGLPDRRGPLAVLVLSLLGVAFWGYSTGDFTRASSFGYFAGWIAVTTSAAGVFGFTRSGVDALTSTKTPPAGAGANPTN
jgi:hypothetical protein